MKLKLSTPRTISLYELNSYATELLTGPKALRTLLIASSFVSANNYNTQRSLSFG